MAQSIEHKHRNIRIESSAVISYALVLPMHRARGRAQTSAAGVFKAFAGLKRGLLADHTGAFDFFCHAIGIVDIPAARDELRRDVTRIRDRHRVGKAKHAHAGRGLRRQVLRADLNSELWAGHDVMLTLCILSLC